MKVTQEKLPASQVGLEIELPPEMSKQAYEQKVREFSQTINIPGFRKGKVPRQVLIQRLGAKRIKMTVLEDLIDSGVRQAIDQEKIEALGNFQLRSSVEDLAENFEPGQPFTFSASVDVPPVITLEEYKGLHIKAEEVKHDPSKVDDVLEDYRNRTATLIPIEDRTVQMGDIAIVDFSGQYIPSEGEEPVDIEGGSGQDFQIEMKEGQFISGFVEGMVGMSAGEEKELDLQFPEDYPQENLAGKPAKFSISLKEIKEKELPDLDDDFAQEISEFETLQELRDTLEKRYQDEAEQKTKQNKQAAIFDELLKKVAVELPESMIKREVDFLVTQTVMRLESQGLEVRKMLSQELVEGMRERARPDAETRLKRTLALGEIAKQENIEVGEDELKAKIEEFMASYPNPGEVDPERVRSVLEDELLEEKVLAWLEENGTVELVPEGTLSPEDSDAESASDEAPEASGVSSSVTAQDSTEDAPDSTKASATAIVDVDVVEVDPSSSEDAPSSDPQPENVAPTTTEETSKKTKKAKSTSKKVEAEAPSTEESAELVQESEDSENKAETDDDSAEKKKKSSRSTRTKKTTSRSKKTKEKTDADDSDPSS